MSLRCVLLLLSITLGACDDAETGIVGADDEAAISLVADGSLALYPELAIGAAADCSFDSTAWGSLISEEGATYVNLEGFGIDSQETEVFIQFRVFRDTATFTLSAMALDQVIQSDAVVLDLVADMMACRPD